MVQVEAPLMTFQLAVVVAHLLLVVMVLVQLLAQVARALHHQ